MFKCVTPVFGCVGKDAYVVRSGFRCSLSDTGSGLQHMILRSYTEYYSVELWEEDTNTQSHGRPRRATPEIHSGYTNMQSISDLQHKQIAL